MPELKKWYKSRTVWSGILELVGGFILTISSFLGGEIGIEALISGLFLIVEGLKNIVLRFKTKNPIQ